MRKRIMEGAVAGEVFVVAYDGEDPKVLDYAVRMAKGLGARLHITHVIHWSPYSFLTPEQLATRHKQRQEEIDRAQETILVPALAKARAAGVSAEGEIRHGNEVDVISAIAGEQKAELIIVGRSRAQSAPVPTLIVP
jgi:nucleotide-binding universal stress UspA family protein